jgi:hypothetical protein
MQAIEFETYIHQHSISIPLKFRQLENIKAKIIVLYEPEQQGNYNKQAVMQNLPKL